MNQEFDGTRKIGIDSQIEGRIDAHCKKYRIDPLDAIKMFPALARRQWLKRFLAHAELFKMTIEVPGDIADLGVFKGLSLMTWANLLEAYCIGDRTKVVYGFDNWAGFTELLPEDGKEEADFQKKVGGFSPEKYFDQLQDAIAIFDADRFVSWKARTVLVKGNIEESVAKFADDNPGVRFSLIHFDCDMYKPTKAALECFWSRLSRGGLMLFDEYALKEWSGETKAVDEFFADKPGTRIIKLPWTNSPSGYLVKD